MLSIHYRKLGHLQNIFKCVFHHHHYLYLISCDGAHCVFASNFEQFTMNERTEIIRTKEKLHTEMKWNKDRKC